MDSLYSALLRTAADFNRMLKHKVTLPILDSTDGRTVGCCSAHHHLLTALTVTTTKTTERITNNDIELIAKITGHY